jgi:zinc/manganese transport system permease protein
MSALYDLLLGPFIEFEFMRRALVGAIALSVGAAPVGVFLMLRRMSLTGDAMAHAILPGAAIGYLMAGLSLAAMTVGGILAGLGVALGAGAMTRSTVLREDTSLAVFYLLSLALGVVIVSLRGSNIDLLHVLFGSVLALDDRAMLLLGLIATVSLLAFAVLLRPLVLESMDAGFLRSVSRSGPAAHLAFSILVVLNLVAGFHALGTLLAVGIMMLPAAAARFWTGELTRLIAIAGLIAIVSSYSGLVAAYHLSLPAGPAIILAAGVLFVLSLILGRDAGLARRWLRPGHLEA